MNPQHVIGWLLSSRIRPAAPGTQLQRLSSIASGQPRGLQVAAGTPPLSHSGTAGPIPNTVRSPAQLTGPSMPSQQPTNAPVVAQHSPRKAPSQQQRSAATARTPSSTPNAAPRRRATAASQAKGTTDERNIRHGTPSGTGILKRKRQFTPGDGGQTGRTPTARADTPLREASTADDEDDFPSSRANLRSANRTVARKGRASLTRGDTPGRDTPHATVETPDTAVSGMRSARRRRIVYDAEDEDFAPASPAPDARGATRSASPEEPSAVHRHRRPQNVEAAPQLDYDVPKQLESTKAAMGEPNWIEYVKLMEAHYDGAILIEEFDRAAALLFRVHDEKTRNMIRRLVNKMVADANDVRTHGQRI